MLLELVQDAADRVVNRRIGFETRLQLEDESLQRSIAGRRRRSRRSRPFHRGAPLGLFTLTQLEGLSSAEPADLLESFQSNYAAILP